MSHPVSLRAAVSCFGILLTAWTAGALPAGAQEPSDPNELFSTMRWRNIGPTRGGRSVTVSGVVGDRSTYYFGSTGGGVWKTIDGGLIWRNVSDGHFNTGSVGAIAVAESDPNVIYVGMGEHAVRGVMTSHGDGVYKSTDAGRTWTHIGLTDTRAISRIRIHPDDPDLVYVAAQGAPHAATEARGIYRSRDGGESWDKVHFVSDRAGAADISMDMNNPRILYAAYWDHLRRPWVVESGGDGSGLWKSTDGGDTWREINDGLPEVRGKIGVDVSRANPDRVFAIVESEVGEGGLYRSDDGGASWRHLNGERVIQGRAWYYMEVYADPQDENTVYVMNAPFMRSIDGGRTFTQVGVPHGDNHDLWINPQDNQVMINANDGGANVSYNGGASWSTQRNQPTAQFYRVITDNQFPYHVYGGQQDNSAIGIASAAPGVIGWGDFYSVSGCESAYLAFDDPDDPRYVYGTCIQGDVDVWDRESNERKPVRPYPELNLGVNAVNHKFRFNWNNPVVGSPHRNGVIYQAGNVLFRTDDQGQSWTEISPDLTRNDDEKHQIGGGPITNENAGGEVYNTIMYVIESPAAEGVLWVGTDDGLIQVSRDGGGSWTDVTPDGVRELGRGTGEAPGEALVNAIEASPHAAGTAYAAVTRYKFNDFTPHIFKTEDYGASWTRIVEGIADEHFVRVVREDPVRPDLLYAGTELGMYISFDGGGQWQRWQLNLPVVPITDLTIQGTSNDLVAATSGRAFWILDDLSPVQQLTADALAAPAHLLQPRDTILVQWGGGFGFGGPVAAGQNPPGGVQIFFHLADEPGDELQVTLQILDSAGDIVRTFATDTEAAGSDASALSAGQGLNRVAWGFNRADVTAVPDLIVFGSFSGRTVPPGDYTAVLTVGDTSQRASFALHAPPWRDATAAEYAAQDAFLGEAQEMLEEVSTSVNRMHDAHGQLDALSGRIAEREEAEELKTDVGALVERIEEWEGEIVQRQTETFQDIINFENKLISQIVALVGSVDGTEPPVTAGARQRLADLQAEWESRQETLTALEADISAINERVRAAGLGGVILPQRQQE